MPPNSINSRKDWTVKEIDIAQAQDIATEANISVELASILIGRNISNASEISKFLDLDIDDLYDPFLMDGVKQAAERIKMAIESHERIMVHGDYDVDGVTATVLLVRTLRILDADVIWYIPHRQREGYDISITGVEEAINQGVKLIITVDCGTSAVEAVKYAADNGIDVIITDHHEIKEETASADIIINPHLQNCGYPFNGLAGVGVAFKLAEAVVSVFDMNVNSFRRRFCDLAAIGTIADVVPMIEENRIFAKCGLDELPRTGKLGLKSLMKVARVNIDAIDSQSVAFVLAPRLNVAGRMDDASLAVDLLLAKDDETAMRLATELDTRNSERQKEQKRIVDEAEEQILAKALAETSKVFVLASSNWHPGIVGIVAGKIAERYCRPSILISMDDDFCAGVGSARSIKSFDIFNALTDCGHLLERFGGHSQAAGLSISGDNLDEFRDLINSLADTCLDENRFFPTVDIDCEIPLDKVNLSLASEIERLEPFGHCNREPIFLTKNCVIRQKRTVGSNGTHLKLTLGQNSTDNIDCIAWGWGKFHDEFPIGGFIDVCYNIRINDYNGRKNPQLDLIDARLPDRNE